jgi:hypothetical protein
MVLLPCLLAGLSVTPLAAGPSVVARASNGSGLAFSVLDPGGRTLLRSQPAALAFFVEQRWWTPAHGLLLHSTRNVSGVHPVLGPFSGHESTWLAGATPVVCSIHAHARAVTFAQTFPDGARGTNVTTQDCLGRSEGSQGCQSEPFGYFPAIDPTGGLLPNMTYFGLSGNMNEYHESGAGLVQPFGGLPSTGGYDPDGATDSGPFVLFEEEGEKGAERGGERAGLHVVLSPSNNFMLLSQALVGGTLQGLNADQHTNTNADQHIGATRAAAAAAAGAAPAAAAPLTYVAGVHYEVKEVPPGFNHTTLLWFGAQGEGVTATVLGWGGALRALHGVGGGKATELVGDVTTTKLGAWTDAGSVYYRPDGGTDMQATLATWAASLREASPPIPVHYLQLDDWFYNTAEGDIRCMTNFTPARVGVP